MHLLTSLKTHQTWQVKKVWHMEIWERPGILSNDERSIIQNKPNQPDMLQTSLVTNDTVNTYLGPPGPCWLCWLCCPWCPCRGLKPGPPTPGPPTLPQYSNQGFPSHITNRDKTYIWYPSKTSHQMTPGHAAVPLNKAEVNLPTRK